MDQSLYILGYWHEQSRQDRDDFLTINWSNIARNMRYNFDKCKGCSNQGLAYDISSVMQYPSWAFAINRQYPVMSSKSNPRQKLGGDNFSKSDIDGINKLYCGGKTTTTTTTTTTGGSKCRNKNKNCRVWAQNWYCSLGNHIAYMRKNCKKACGMCR